MVATAIVVVVVVAIVVVVVWAIEVAVVGVGELVCWTKARQVAPSTDLGPYLFPSLAFGGIDPFLDPAPLLRRNKKQLKRVRGRQLRT